MKIFLWFFALGALVSANLCAQTSLMAEVKMHFAKTQPSEHKVQGLLKEAKRMGGALKEAESY